MQRGALTIALVCGSLAYAHAQPTDADREFERGRTLMDAGKFAEACAAFDASERIEPQVATELNQGDCREKNRQLATAHALFAAVAKKTAAATDARSKKFHKTASDRVAKLAQRLSHVTVRVAAPVAELVVLRGPAPMQAGVPEAVDGGTYEIVVRAPGHQAWSKSIVVRDEGDQQIVEVPPLAAEPVATRTVAPVPPRTERPPERSSAPRSRRTAYLFGGGALALGGLAVGFELSARSAYRRSETEANDSVQDDLWNTSNTRRHVAQGLAIGAVGCAAVAVWQWLRASDGRRDRSARVLVEPLGATGLQVRGSW